MNEPRNRFDRVFGPRPARDVDEELTFHIEMRVQELIEAGETPERARELALAEALSDSCDIALVVEAAGMENLASAAKVYFDLTALLGLAETQRLLDRLQEDATPKAAKAAIAQLTAPELATPYLRLREMRAIVDPDGPVRGMVDGPAVRFPDGGRRRAEDTARRGGGNG